MTKASTLPRLDIFEGLQQWGEVRIRPDHLDNTISVELRRRGTEEWKPLVAFIALDGRIMLRVVAEKNDRVVCYDAVTNTISDVTSKAQIRNNPSLRNREVGKDNNGS